MTPARCRSCGASILWVVMPSGKRMPIDALAHAEGTVYREDEPIGDRARVLVGTELSTAQVHGAGLHRSHFATCPQATSHRRGSGPGKR